MSGVNKAIILGRLGQDPEIRYMQNGNAVANISIATSEKWKDKNTGQMQEKTEWHRVSMFGKLAELAQQYLFKGSEVFIEGKLQTDKYTDKQGVEKYTTQIIANNMTFIGSKSDNSSAGQQDTQQPAQPQQPQQPQQQSRPPGAQQNSQQQQSGQQPQPQPLEQQNQPRPQAGYAQQQSAQNKFVQDDDIPF